MQPFIFLLVLYLLAVLVALPIWVIVKIQGHGRELERLRRGLLSQEARLAENNASPRSAAAASPSPASVTPLAPAPEAPPISFSPPPAVAAPRPPPLPSPPPAPPPIPSQRPAVPARPAINWEQFMGAKLFAWLGGLALFLGVAFFVKYSFEHELIPPQVRVALGFLLGAGLVVGGQTVPAERYRVTAHTLVATGIVSLYAVTFACDSVYHFAFFGPLPTFLVMALITAAAFLLAVRLNAQVVALLGILGGFLTPVLISTGRDDPAGLFGYLAILVVGLVAVALRRGWHYLVPLGAAGTTLMLAAWADTFYAPGKTGTVIAVGLGFSAIHFLTYLVARRLRRATSPILWSAVGMPLVSLVCAFLLLLHPVVAARPGLLFPLIFASDAFLLALAWWDERMSRLHVTAGLASFALLSIWTAEALTDALLPWALAASLLFAALHTAFPLLLARRRPSSAPSWWNQLFPPLALVLVLLPIYQLEPVSFLVWPAVLLIDLLALIVAALSASLAAIAAVLVLTLVATGLCLFQVPAGTVFDPSLLFLIGVFSVFFFFAGLWLARRFGDQLPALAPRLAGLFGGTRGQIPAFSALLPYLLLIMVCARLAVPDPSMVFGLGLLLVILTLGLARLYAADWLPVCALVGMAALEYVWHALHFNPAAPGRPLAWYVGSYVVFAVYPFVFRRHFSRLTGPWAAAALSGPAHFWMAYQAIKRGWPNPALGLVPAAFSLAPLGSLFVIFRTVPKDNPKRLNQLAWFGGVALAFLTLIFPIQFERQWFTVAWALEGAALLWLFHRVPHPGLRATGVVLLVAAFVRLALNPAVLDYHLRCDIPLFNWYLHTYGAAIAALFLGARLLAPPRETVLGVNARPLLCTLGVVLSFLILNIEIADYFTAPGARSLAFQFSGNFARDMCYTIGWALFALGLLSAGIWRRQRSVRYAALALLGVALFKLFLHDLAHLEALYRIGALFGVAVIAILASFAYQRFLPSQEKSTPTPPDPGAPP